MIPASRHECAGVIWLMRYTLRFSGFELVSIPYGGFDMICLFCHSVSVRHELLMWVDTAIVKARLVGRLLVVL